jgi:diguanylate cyclase (GGDEF)-like protein
MQTSGGWNDALDEAFTQAESRLLRDQPELMIQRTLRTKGFAKANVTTAPPGSLGQAPTFAPDKKTPVHTAYERLTPALDDLPEMNERFAAIGGKTHVDLTPEGVGRAMAAAQPDIPGARAVVSGLQQSVLGGSSLMARVFQQENAAREMSAMQGEVAASDDTFMGRALAGWTRSMIDMLTAAGLGPAGVIGYFTSLATNNAIDEGREQGLERGELVAYALEQGAIEGVVTSAFQAVGLGGMESMKAPLKAGIKNGLKAFGKRSLAEFPEEVIIDLGQRVSRYAHDVDPDAFDPDRMAEDLASLTLQVLMGTGSVEAVSRIGRTITPEAEVDPTPMAGRPEQQPGPARQLGPDRLLPSPEQVTEGQHAGIDERAGRQQAAAMPLPSSGQTIFVSPQGAAMSESQMRERDEAVRLQTQEREERMSRPALPPASEARFLVGDDGTAVDLLQPAPAEQRTAEMARGRAEVDALIAAGNPEAAQARITELEKELRTDSLTGVGNKRSWDEGLQELKGRADKNKVGQSFIWFDAANLKIANTQLGHEGADQVLREMAQKIQQVVGDRGTITRQGGDEFGVVLKKNTSKRKAKQIRDEIETAIGDREIVPGASMFLSGGVGVLKPGQGITSAVTEADMDSEARKKQKKERLGQEVDRTVIERKLQQAAQQVSGTPLNLVPEASVDAARRREFRRIEMVRRRLHEAADRIAEQSALAAIQNDPDALAAATIGTPAKGSPRQPGRLRSMISTIGVPVSTVVRNFSPRLYGRMKQYEHTVKMEQHDAKSVAKKYYDRLRRSGLTREQQRQVQFLRRFRSSADANLFIQENVKDPAKQTELLAAFDSMRLVKDSIYDQARAMGVGKGYIEDHMPSSVRDYDAWVADMHGTDNDRIAASIRIEEAKKGRALTTTEKVHVANLVVRGYGPRKPGQIAPRRLSQRTVEDLTFEQFDKHYVDEEQAMYEYLDAVIIAKEKAKLLGKAHEDEDIKESVGRLILEGKFGASDLQGWQRDRLVAIITSRFTTGELAPNWFLQATRQIGYVATLADPSAAAIQFGDIGLIMARDGVLPGLAAIPAATREEVLTARNMGLDMIGEEFADRNGVAKLTQAMMTWSGFRRLDTSMKTVNMVSAVAEAKRRTGKPDSKEFAEFKQEWEPVLAPGEFDSLVRDIQAGRKSDLVLLYAYMRMSDTQPVDLMEVPQSYLAAPNGRIFYMLKTFAMKQFDFYRRNTMDRIVRGVKERDTREAQKGMQELVRMATILSLTYASFDWLRDWLLGREPDFTDSMLNGLLGIFGGSTYVMGSTVKDGVGSAIFDFLAPPTSHIDDPVIDLVNFSKSISEEDPDKRTLRTLRHVPLIGRFLFWRFGTGAKWVGRQDHDDARDLAVDAVLKNDIRGASAIINAYNDSAKSDQKKLSMMSIRSTATRRANEEKKDDK